MATVICKMYDCIHRSKYPLKRWTNMDGSKCFGCKLDVIVVTGMLDYEGKAEAIFGRTEITKCAMYEPKGEYKNEPE